MMEYRTGFGYDIHRLEEGLEMVLGGVHIPHKKGCVAHSDGDALIHALCDAMLGALALGDIGMHFPDNSDEFKGIDSKILLSRVNEMVQAEGWQLGNADMMLLLQKPKIAPFVPMMRQTLADVLGVEVSRISVKATTNEGLGPIGNEEGVAAYATVLLQK